MQSFPEYRLHSFNNSSFKPFNKKKEEENSLNSLNSPLLFVLSQEPLTERNNH